MASLFAKAWKRASGAKAPVQSCEHQQNSSIPTQHGQGSIVGSTELKSYDSSTTTKMINNTAAEPCTICKTKQRAATIYRAKLIAGLFLPFTLQALDVTIVASALPFIASDFNELSQINWIVSAFNLTAATFIPAWGQLADIFGRHAAMQACLICMLLGSALCAGAPHTAFPMLLVGRAIQGLSCAGLNVLTKIILADKVSLRDNAKNNSIFAIFAGVGYGIGPVIGGYLTSANWRWVFGLNIPIALVAIVVLFIVLRPELLGPQDTRTTHKLEPQASSRLRTSMVRVSSIDLGGQFLFLFGMGLLIIAFTWGGSYYAWHDAHVLAPLIIGALLLICFSCWEYLMMPGKMLAVRFPNQKAMIPFGLMFSRNAGLLFYISFVGGMAMYAVFYFADFYFVLVKQYTSENAGVQLLYYTPGLGVGVYLAVYFCSSWPRQTWLPIALGTLIEPTGITVLAVALRAGHLPTIYGLIALTGAGTGMRFMPGTLHATGYYPTQIAPIMSLLTLGVSLGGTCAMTLMFSIFNNRMRDAGINLSATSTSSLASIAHLAPNRQAYIRAQATSAIFVAFLALSAFLWLGLAAVAALGNVNITEDKGVVEKNVEEERAIYENVTEGSYIGSLLGGRRRRGGKRETGPMPPLQG